MGGGKSNNKHCHLKVECMLSGWGVCWSSILQVQVASDRGGRVRLRESLVLFVYVTPTVMCSDLVLKHYVFINIIYNIFIFIWRERGEGGRERERGGRDRGKKKGGGGERGRGGGEREGGFVFRMLFTHCFLMHNVLCAHCSLTPVQPAIGVCECELEYEL